MRIANIPEEVIENYPTLVIEMSVTVTARSVERVEKHVERVEMCRAHT